MSTFSFNKSGNDGKSNTLGSMNRQNVIQENNKRRTLLKDSSWIKNRPEEEEEKIRDENFGKSVLNRYKSQEDLDSGIDKDDKKPLHNRFRSDDALDRIPSRNTFEGGNKAATLERVPASGPETTNKSRQSWAPSNTTTTTTTTEESKRKSWAPTNRNTTTTTTTTTETRQVVPGKPEGQKITIISSDTRNTDNLPKASFVDSARSRFEKNEEKPSSPTSPRAQYVDEKPKLPPRSPIAKTEDRPSYPTKPVVPELGDIRRSSVERKQRSQDIDNLIDVSTSRVNKRSQDVDNLIDISTSKVNKRSQDIDNLIEIPKVNKRTQDVDNLIDISTSKVNKSTQDVDNLIDIKPPTDKGKKREQLDDFIEISNTAKNYQKKDDNLDSLIEIKKPDVKTRNDNLDNLIEIKNPDGKTRTSSLDDLIDIKTTTTTKRSQDLDDLIAITGDRGTAKPASTNLTNRSSTTTTTYKEDPSDAPSRRSTTTSKVTEYHDVPSRRSTTSSTYKVTDDSYDAPTRRSTTSYRDTTDGPNSSSNVTVTQETSYSSLPNSSYGDISRRPNSNAYGENIVSNSIKTVYSTSDRTVMEKDICTYCRKTLGIDAKMILKDLNICCHATCFKCEACSGSLGNLKAGDSMWIYKQSIHCEPCYFAAREKWIL